MHPMASTFAFLILMETKRIKNFSTLLRVLHTRVCVIMFGFMESDLFAR